MLKDLVKVANKLDSLGFQREADVIDAFIRDTLNETGIGYTYNWNVNWSGEPEGHDLDKEATHFNGSLKKVSSDELDPESYIEESDEEKSEANHKRVEEAKNLFYSKMPSSVEDKVKYYAENMAELESEGLRTKNFSLVRWANNVMDDFFSVIQQTELEEEGEEFSYDSYKMLTSYDQFKDWERDDFKDSYDMFESMRKK